MGRNGLDTERSFHIEQFLQLLAQSEDPQGVLNDVLQMWLSDGTDSGDSGDLYFKIHKDGDPGQDATHKLMDFIGNVFADGYMLASKANAGGISAVADGTVALDMTQGNLFTNTPSQNTVWSTTAPTNGIGGHLAAFVIDNAGGYTVSWSTGFTNVTPIAADDTGISIRLLQFNGTTWYQIAATLNGNAINTQPEVKHLIPNLWGPNGIESDDSEVCIWPVTDAEIVISKITVTLNAAGNEVLGDVKYADAFIGLANPVVINDFDTTSGVRVDSSITVDTIPAGKCVYLSFDSSPHVDISQMCIDIEYTYVGPKHSLSNVWNPNAVQSDDNEVCLWPVTDADLTISKITVTLNASGNEVAGDLKYADAFIGLANPVVINTFDTTSGVLADDSITVGVIPAGKCIYFAFDSSPHVDITQMCVDITYTYD